MKLSLVLSFHICSTLLLSGCQSQIGENELMGKTDQAINLPPGKLYSGFSSNGNIYYYMLPSGKIMLGCPRGGLENFDFNANCTKSPAACGVYTISGGALNITWDDNRKVAGKISANGDIDINGSLVGEMQKVPTTLSASYDFGIISSTVSVAERTTFKADGTYEVFKVGGVSSNDGKDGANWTSGSKGKYTIKGFTISMTESNGKTTSHTIYTMGTATENPDYLGWDGNFLNKI